MYIVRWPRCRKQFAGVQRQLWVHKVMLARTVQPSRTKTSREQPALTKPFGSSGPYFFCSSSSACRIGQWGFICLTRMLGRGRNVCEVLSSCDAQWSNASMNNIFCSIFHDSQLMYQRSVTFGIMLVDRNAQNVYLQDATKKSNWYTWQKSLGREECVRVFVFPN